MDQPTIDNVNALITTLQAFAAANPVSTQTYVPTEDEVKAAVEAGIIAAYTPKDAAANGTLASA